MHHAREECSLVLQIPNTQTLQSSDAATANTTSSRVAFARLSHELRLVTPRQAQLTDIWHDDERPSEDTFVSGFGTFDELRSKNDIQRPRH